MSIGLGTIIVQNKKEPAGVSEAESGLHMDGSKARLGGMLLENTDIDIDTKTFFLQWDGGAGAFLIDVFDDKYFFGTIDGSFNLETGFIFKENEAAVKLNGNAAVSARGQAGVGSGIVYEFGDVESVNNGTKITIKDDTETVEITNVPAGNTTNDFATFDGDQIKKIPAPVESGTYTPTAVAGSNIASIVEYPCQYLRVGQVVNFSGQIETTVTTPGITSVFTINPPIVTAIINENELSGAGIIDNSSSTVQSIVNDGTGKAVFSFIPATWTTIICFNITYLITSAP